jgi:hypothetical protein
MFLWHALKKLRTGWLIFSSFKIILELVPFFSYFCYFFTPFSKNLHDTVGCLFLSNSCFNPAIKNPNSLLWVFC